jgi:hypothetical protein
VNLGTRKWVLPGPGFEGGRQERRVQDFAGGGPIYGKTGKIIVLDAGLGSV